MPKTINKISNISKITQTRFSNPFAVSSHKTERSASALIMHWMRNIIQEKNIDLGPPDVETGGGDNRFPDTIIYESQRSKNVLCVLEFKPPFWDIFREDDPKEPARKKAVSRKARYFVTSNFRELILWNTEKVNANKQEEEQIVNRYELSDIFDLDKLEDSRYKNSIQKGLERFLIDLYELFSGKKQVSRLAIDELLIWRLQEKINKLAYYYQDLIYNEAHKNKEFAQSLAKWFNGQGWNFYIESGEDYQKVARQTAYLLVNKILFYNALQLKKPAELAPLTIPDDITQGGILKDILQGYFNAVLKIDYETIYTTDFIDKIAFPESREVVCEIKELTNVLKRYNFATLGFEVIGRIFERLIPEEERHNLGQYFTNSDVVDLILQFCIQNEKDKIFDPSCGAGTFLVRAYQLKKLMNQRSSHEEILNTLWGNDIAKFPAHLATINLAINDLSVDKNYPRIIQKDFFDLLSSDENGIQLPQDVRKVLLKTMSNEEFKIIHPQWFDAIVGNPPYTRQEEISEISGEATYKDKLIEKALNYGAQKLASISKRAGIYVYFFIHGTKFLRNNSRFGFIVSNAWLDVEYGTGLQEFFLKNYKIVAIIESKVERWFKDADINTCIVILEKAAGQEKKEEREKNLVRFVYLLKPLRHFIPAAKDIWEKQIERKQVIENLRKTILAHNDFYQNDELRIFPKKQSELYEEGFDEKTQKYEGAKWEKYIRAPNIFFKILEKAKDKLEPLKNQANIVGGIITGNNSFFYFNKQIINKVESRFLKPVIKTPRELNKIIFNEKGLKYKILICDDNKSQLKNTKLLSYIKLAENKGINKTKTFKNRNPWYSLPEKKAPLLWVDLRGDKHLCHLNQDNILFEHNFYGLNPIIANEKNIYQIAAILNSTLIWFFIEILGRVGLGGGAIRLISNEILSIPMIKNDVINKKVACNLNKQLNVIGERAIGSAFFEIGASSSDCISLDKVKPDRRVLDQIIMDEILGLTNEEQLEVYRAVVDLVKSRIEKAKSAGSRKKTKSGLDIDLAVNTIIAQIGEKKLKEWYKEKILSQKDLQNKKLLELAGELKIEKSLFDWQIRGGEKSFKCSSQMEARYLLVWLKIGIDEIYLPQNPQYLAQITLELEQLKQKIDEIIESHLGSILDQKLKSQILHRTWRRLM